jgi:hypothetical protein
VAAVLAASLVGSVPAHAEALEDAGWGVLTVLTNVVYMPAKVLYATLGGLTGGLALGLTGGDMQTAEKVWTPSMTGTYVVTPRMLQGVEPIEFAGGWPPAAAGDAARTDQGRGDMVGDAQGLSEQPLGGT